MDRWNGSPNRQATRAQDHPRCRGGGEGIREEARSRKALWYKPPTPYSLPSFSPGLPQSLLLHPPPPSLLCFALYGVGHKVHSGFSRNIIIILQKNLNELCGNPVPTRGLFSPHLPSPFSVVLLLPPPLPTPFLSPFLFAFI